MSKSLNLSKISLAVIEKPSHRNERLSRKKGKCAAVTGECALFHWLSCFPISTHKLEYFKKQWKTAHFDMMVETADIMAAFSAKPQTIYVSLLK